MKQKVGIIGLLCTDMEIADGQSIKTRIVAREIEKNIGSQHMRKIDTYGWKKHPLRLLFDCVKSVNACEHVVFLTDAGGIKIFPWLLTCSNVFARRQIYYVVVGGWLVHFVKEHKILSWFLKHLDGVFVETEALRKGLEELGFKNVYLMPNCKDLQPLTEQQLSYPSGEPYRFCIFSRIMKEKGVACAVEAIQRINADYGRIVCTLDLYGKIDAAQTEWFEQLKKTFSTAVQYRGVVPFDKSVDVLKDYYALLFPTQFYTEGIPGTIIDAYAAGVPVITSEWESVRDILETGMTGISYPFENPELLQECLVQFIETPQQVFEMKKKCLKKANEYLPNAVMDTLLSKLK